MWLLLKPIMVLICEITLTDDNRAVFLIIWDVTILVLGQVILLGMYHPNLRINSGFPYHKITSVMLGLVQGETASDFIRTQTNAMNKLMNGTPPPAPANSSPIGNSLIGGGFNNNSNSNNSSSPNNNNSVLKNTKILSLSAARNVIKQTGTEISMAINQIASAGQVSERSDGERKYYASSLRSLCGSSLLSGCPLRGVRKWSAWLTVSLTFFHSLRSPCFVPGRTCIQFWTI